MTATKKTASSKPKAPKAPPAKPAKVIRSWTVSIHSNHAFTAPECRGNPSLGGIPDIDVLGNENVEKRKILTSSIASYKGRTVTTESGSVYVLTGEPNQHFLDFIKDKGLKYDKRAPIAPLVVAGYVRIERTTSFPKEA